MLIKALIFSLLLFFNNSCSNGNINYNNIKTNIIGEIRINDKVNDIVYGHEKDKLDNNFVGAIIDNKNIILAGHNNKNIFNIITTLNYKDKITLIIYDKKYDYQVTNIYKLNKDDYFYYDNNSDELNLITCVDDNKKRLIVNAYRVN